MTLFQLSALIGLILLVAFGRLAVNSFRNGRSKLSELRAALALARGNTDTLRAELLERAAEHSKLYARSRELARELSLARNAADLSEERRASADDTALELSGRVRELQSRVDTLRNEANNASAAHKREIERLLKDVEEFTRADLRAANEIGRLSARVTELEEQFDREKCERSLTRVALLEEQAIRRQYAEDLERLGNELKATQASLQNKRTMLEKIRNAGELHTEGKSFELFDVDQQIGDELAKARSERDELRGKLDEVIRVGSLPVFEINHFDHYDRFDKTGQPIADTGAHSGPEFEAVRRLIAVTKEALDIKTSEMGLRDKLRETVEGLAAERREVYKASQITNALREERDVLVTAKNDLESKIVRLNIEKQRHENHLNSIANRAKLESESFGGGVRFKVVTIRRPGFTVTPAGARRRGAGVAPKAKKGGRS